MLTLLRLRSFRLFRPMSFQRASSLADALCAAWCIYMPCGRSTARVDLLRSNRLSGRMIGTRNMIQRLRRDRTRNSVPQDSERLVDGWACSAEGVVASANCSRAPALSSSLFHRAMPETERERMAGLSMSTVTASVRLRTYSSIASNPGRFSARLLPTSVKTSVTCRPARSAHSRQVLSCSDMRAVAVSFVPDPRQ